MEKIKKTFRGGKGWKTSKDLVFPEEKKTQRDPKIKWRKKNTTEEWQFYSDIKAMFNDIILCNNQNKKLNFLDKRLVL